MEGRIAEDGWILCTCQKKVGHLDENRLEFACPCGNRVQITFDLIHLRACEKAIEATHQGLATLNTIVSRMHQLKCERHDPGAPNTTESRRPEH